jgi:hypothetical protein
MQRLITSRIGRGKRLLARGCPKDPPVLKRPTGVRPSFTNAKRILDRVKRGNPSVNGCACCAFLKPARLDEDPDRAWRQEPTSLTVTLDRRGGRRQSRTLLLVCRQSKVTSHTRFSLFTPACSPRAHAPRGREVCDTFRDQMMRSHFVRPPHSEASLDCQFRFRASDVRS